MWATLPVKGLQEPAGHAQAGRRTQQEDERLGKDGVIALGSRALLLLPGHVHVHHRAALQEAALEQGLARQVHRALYEHVQHATLHHT